MPQITKIRIVNFQYNNGKRIIADELYDFENESRRPSDVLINLVNGGGKSVLVQLMMQPIIPRAKVAGRKIESFFTKSTDHCYVVLEWVLDNSKMKLLTGIAMAASDKSADPDSDRGFQIKYYTFMSSYQDDQGGYDIASLPLSKKENGRYIPAFFEDIRNLSKKSNGRLERFSSDDGVNWRERLSAYGIIQNEWRMIEDLNSNEDGLSKYFSNLKSSDALIDALIIPRIEEKQKHSASGDDSSLETMLISYAKNYSAKQDVIKERDICKRFLDMLRVTKTEAEELWKNNDSFEKSVADLFAYSDALQNEKLSRIEEHQRLKSKKEKLKNEELHVRREKASADYYRCKDVFDKETDNLKNAEHERDKAKNLKDEAERNLRLTECAHYYEKIVEKESQIKSITSEIESREHNSESSKKLAKLKYSAYCAINTELKRIRPEIKSLSEISETIRNFINLLDKELSNIRTELETAKTEADKSEAVFDMQCKNNDKTVAELHIGAFRMLDGKYSEKDLKEWEDENHAHIKSVERDIQMIDEEIQRLDQRRDAIPAEIAGIETEISKAKTDFASLENEIREYFDAEAKVKEICEKYNLDYELRFTDYVNKYLLDRCVRTEAEIKAEEKKIDATEEAIAAVERGTLHIPKPVTDYLDGTGLHYTTFERYILEQRKKDLLSEKDVRSLLSLYPYAAYGIIVDEKDTDTFLNESEGKWLPAVLPVFHADEIDKMLNGSHDSFRAIAAYARDYFLNKEEYSSELRLSAVKQNENLNLLIEREKILSADNSTVKAFSVYDQNWISSKQSDKKGCEGKISAGGADIIRLKKEQETVKESILEAKEKIERKKSERIECENTVKNFNKLTVNLREEEDLYEQKQNKRKTVNEIKAIESEKTSLKITRNDELNDTEGRLKELKRLADEMEKKLSFVDNAEKTDIVSGKWNALFEMYKTSQEAQSTDLRNLSVRKNNLLIEKDDLEKEIQKKECPRDEYVRIIYSEEKEKAQSAAVKYYEKLYQEKDFVYGEVNCDKARAQGRLETSCKNLEEFGGEALPKNEIGLLFDRRIEDINRQLSLLSRDCDGCDAELKKLEKIQGRTETITENYVRPPKYDKILLETNYGKQLSSLENKIKEAKNSVDTVSRKVEHFLKEMSDACGDFSADIDMAIRSMKDLLSNEAICGDRYFTLCEHIDANTHTAELRISQIDTDLTEFQKTKDDLIRQCVIQGKQMHEGLMQLSNNSKVKVQGKRRPMLCFEIPEAIDENVASATISAEIDKGTLDLAAKLSEDGYTDSEIRKIASRTVGSKRLLRKYTGFETIVLKAYKIDRNPDNSGYRTWEETHVNNSGAEKFVVYFAVILALMAYARDNGDDIGTKQNRSVLILDNPFGPISSKHVLEPMFEIARNYNVQMICLSDISKSDIVSCFDLVIRAVVKQFALSTKEQLTHEGNEKIEHGFYRSEQLNLF